MDVYLIAFFTLGIGAGLCAGYLIGHIAGGLRERAPAPFDPANSALPLAPPLPDLPPVPEEPDWGDDWWARTNSYPLQAPFFSSYPRY